MSIEKESLMEKTLTESLIEYGQSDYYPFHMPGHKRNHSLPSFDPLSMDITEIDGFDNLHHPKGLIQSGMKKAAKLYHAERSYFLINGSTCGILSSICAATHPGDTILMARNSHQSAYHAAYLNQLHIIYLYPEFISDCEINGGISSEKVKQKLIAFPQIKAVFLTSPTYEGIVSDIAKIAEIVHSFQIPLIVDEAHGAHFGFHKFFPKSAVTCGADLVIQSLHKTLPAFTQTALLHCNGTLIEQTRLESYLNIYQTSSPSYLLMASIDSCINLLEAKGKELMEAYAKKLTTFQEELSTNHFIFLQNIHKTKENSIYDVDKSKLLLSCQVSKNFFPNRKKAIPKLQGLGMTLYYLLKEHYHLQCEMYMGNYVLAMTSFMDTEEGFSRLSSALKEIDKKIEGNFTKQNSHPISYKWNFPYSQITAENVLTIAQSQEYPFEQIPLAEAKQRICKDFIYLYPPGIPFIVPGERISPDILQQIIQYQQQGFEIHGLVNGSIRVIKI